MENKCLESFEMWCWGRTEKVKWTVLDEGVLKIGDKESKVL